MRLTWREIRHRAAEFVERWEGKERGYEKGETQLFYQEFFGIFDVSVRRVGSFEAPVRKLDDSLGFIDLFWKGVLLVEQKSAGRNLERARDQAYDYFTGITESDLPQFVLLSDFQSFVLIDHEAQDEVEFPLSSLPDQIERFGFIIGRQKRVFRDQGPVNIQASELVGQLHDQLKASGYDGHDLERFLVRLVFCLFADDTGIFEPRDSFLDYLEHWTQPDGSDLGGRLTELFQVLDTPEGKRQDHLHEALEPFPYINGDLFRDQLRIPAFDTGMREQLIKCCSFDWSVISPAIFGALFQSVMDAKKRRAIGAHYTTEQNIMKVIQPLFLDDLTAEAERILALRGRTRKSELIRFQQKLARLTFFDPACGCGNFLVITYREIRRLEMRIIKALRTLRHADRQDDLAATDLSLVNVDQFYGVELEEFPVRVAETAMWMMDHIMNNQLSLLYGLGFVRIPLRSAPTIIHGDALEVDWTDILPAQNCSYILGNPPFSGSKTQSDDQRRQVRDIARLGGTGGTLDYVAAWFIKAASYVQSGKAPIGFVATNSITQGEQVGQLWPILFDQYGLRIVFAHRTFAWGSEARGRANVHVVILGLENAAAPLRQARLYHYEDIKGEPEEVTATAISPYLFDTGGKSDAKLVVHEEGRPINGWRQSKSGSQPIDDQHYILTETEYMSLCETDPSAAMHFRRYFGAKEFINGVHRYIVHPASISPSDLAHLPELVKRVQAVREFRAKSNRKQTLRLANYPTEFNVTVLPEVPFLALPETSSERREFVPIGWMEPPDVPSNALRIVESAKLIDFALLTSTMHMTWMRAVCGRLKNDYRYSIGVVYNAFPVPEITARDAAKIEPLAQAILEARAAYPDATLAHLYDPDTMPPPLRRAHHALDRAVDRLYQRKPFTSEHDRLQHLFERYQKMKQPLV